VSTQRNRCVQRFRQGLCLGMGALVLWGCHRLPGLSPSNPDASSAENPALQSALCDTPTYRAKVVTEQDQLSLSFAQKPDAATLVNATPVSVTENSDGSRTYGFQGETTTYARFYSDGTCLVQVVAADGTINLEESGTTAPSNAEDAESIVSSDLEQPDLYQQGYDQGYRDGYQSGEAFRREKRGNNPGLAFPVDAATGNESQDRGYREGFYDGFAGGYDSFISQEPNLDDLSMRCAGSIEDDVDFTVFYTRESGFSRIDFKPRQSSQTLTANLSYAEEDEQNHSIWRGNVAQMADVVLIHLSANAPKPGDEVSVGYDNRWGRANCR